MSTGTKLRNIGPKSAAWLRQTGIRTQEDLVAVGSLAAFVRVKRAGFKPSLNLLYALEGAILGCHWQEIPDERRSELVLAAGEEVSKLPLPKGKRMPAAGPVTTVRHDDDDAAMPEPDFGFDDPSAAPAD
ncbi:MAG: transcriptional regulator [Lysobacterales bacterium GWF1_69_6]|nr:MAG: transcriptional regulator [Xanthomonadales bacterium GWF1_69_6]